MTDISTGRYRHGPQDRDVAPRADGAERPPGEAEFRDKDAADAAGHRRREPEAQKGRRAKGMGAHLRGISLRRFFHLSPLTVQMIVIHLFGLLLITGGVLYLSQSGENLIDAHQRLLEARARILAGTMADAILESGNENMLLNRRDLIQILRRPTSTDGTYARIYDAGGELITDSDLIHDRIEQIELPPLHKPVSSPGPLSGLIDGFSDFLLGSRYEVSDAKGPMQISSNTEGIDRALQGEEAILLKRNKNNELVVSFFTPIQPVQHVVGALVLEVYDVDEAIRAERESVVRLFLVAAVISFGLLMLLGQTVVRPIRRLADAADVIRRGKTGRTQIPDFSHHNNEIGDLSLALRDMTNALYDRLEQNERFAADVAHEIKNPLTSLRSAVETFELAKTDEMRLRLVTVIKDDVGRIDRLISDISRISRLDAELARKSARPVDLYTLLGTISDFYNATKKRNQPGLEVIFESPDLAREGRYIVPGFEDSLGQVINNLIDNARSFSPPDGVIRITTMRRYRAGSPIVIIHVEDDGPGIPEDNLENIFERFYTQRPDGAAFGTHSGLGLNICRQIIEAHGGTIVARNRYRRDGDEGAESSQKAEATREADGSNADRNGSRQDLEILGARFVITLPTGTRHR